MGRIEGVGSYRMPDEYGWESILKRLVAEMEQTSVTELDVRLGEVRVRLRRRQDPPVGADTGSDPGATQSRHAATEVAQELHPVLAPLTGVFYASPNPSARAYVEVGDWVEDGVVLGLIETMKVFNEVTADCQGRVVAIQVQQGQLIQSGEVVALVDTAATPDQPDEVAP